MPFFIVQNAIRLKDENSVHCELSDEHKEYFFSLKRRGITEISGPIIDPDDPLLQVRRIVHYVETYSDFPAVLAARRMDPTFYEVHIFMQEFCISTGATRLPMKVEVYDNDWNLVMDQSVHMNDLF
jgi:hypothetical protein